MKYGTYKVRIHRSIDRVTCNFCDSESRKPADHARHVHEVHELKNRTHCPWCYEPFPSKGVEKNVSHLSNCFTQLVAYDKCVREATFEMSCCDGQSFSPGDYANHRHSVHGLDKNSDCPWCDVHSTASLSHRMTCLEKKIKDRKRIDQKKKPEVCHACIEFDSARESLRLYGRSKMEDVDPSFYEPFEVEHRWFVGGPHVRFTDASGLGEDAPRYILQFIRLQDEDYFWVHFFVRAEAFGSFHEAVATSSVYLLPFSCLCDGTTNRDCKPAYRHHRHCIAMCSSREAFYEMWDKVKFSTQLEKGQNSKSIVEIKTVHHLCNAMNYVSGRRSGCKGIDLHRKPYDEKTKRRHHYHIFRPFCPHANRYLHMCYSGGPQRYNEQLHGPRYVWDKATLGWENGRAYILTSDLPSDGCRPPLAPDLMEIKGLCSFDNGETSFIGLWTLEDRPIYLLKTSVPCSDRLEQGDLKFFLTKPQKRIAQELEFDRDRARERSKRVEEQHEKEKRVMSSEKDRAIQEMAKLLSENSKLRETVQQKDRKLQQKDSENKKLKSDNVNLRNEIASLKKDLDYDREIMDMKDDFNRRLSEKDNEIKQLLLDKLKVVNNLYEENKQLYWKIVKQMEDKIELKDQISFVFEQLVKMLPVRPPPIKRQKMDPSNHN